jgi:KDO2-lipid IV(A) lauroyltransferase
MRPADAPRVRWRWRLEYALVRALVGAIELLPTRAAVALAGGLGRLMHLLLPGRVRLARRQMAAALGLDPADARVKADVRACFRHFLRVPAELIKLPAALRRRTPEQVVRLSGKEHFDRASAGGRGAIFLTGHLGNWEVMGALAPALGVPLTSVGRPIDNPLLERELLRLRGRYGQRVIAKDGAGLRLARELKQGHAVALLLDQHAGRRGVRVPFFHEKASTFTFVAALAHRFGLPLLPIFSRCGERPHEVDVAIGPPIDPDPALPEAEDAWRMTLLYQRALEAAVRAAPAQYLWFHRRWKESGADPDPKWVER